MISLYKALWGFFGIYFHIFSVAYPKRIVILAQVIVINGNSGSGNPWVGYQVFIVTCYRSLQCGEFIFLSFLTVNISKSPCIFLIIKCWINKVRTK